MNLGRQIHTLLKRQSSVYINRLGCFKRVHTPATFDEKRQVFLPPITFVEFESDCKDGYDFVTYIQQANQSERSEAEALVEVAVSLILDKLNQSGQAQLDNLGQLISYGNSYVFKPLDLSGFNYTEVEDTFTENKTPNEEQSAVVEEVVEKETVAVHSINEERISEDQGSVVGNYAEQSMERQSTSAYVYALVGLIAVALLGGLYYYSTYLQVSPVIADKELVLVPQDTIAATDTLAIELPVDSLLTEQDTSSLLTAEPELEKEAVAADTPTPANHKYTIVIGTHRTLAQAYEEAEAFNKDGHKSVRVITPNLAKNLKRVVWDTYATKEERDSALRYVKKHIKTDAWPDLIR